MAFDWRTVVVKTLASQNELIPIKDCEETFALRPADKGHAQQIAADLKSRGWSPIEPAVLIKASRKGIDGAPPRDVYLVISGNHRVQAARKVGLLDAVAKIIAPEEGMPSMDDKEEVVRLSMAFQVVQPYTKPPNFTSQIKLFQVCLLYTSPSPRDGLLSRMPSSA